MEQELIMWSIPRLPRPILDKNRAAYEHDLAKYGEVRNSTSESFIAGCKHERVQAYGTVVITKKGDRERLPVEE